MPHLSGSARQAKAVTVIKVDRDYITSSVNEVISDPLCSRTGLEWKATPGIEYDYATHAIAPDAKFEKTRFRILDDDSEVYYGGWLYNDEGCINQDIVLSWAMYDAGATEIQVKINDVWVTQIG